MNKESTSCIRVNQWKNSSVVMRCLGNIENKLICLFTIFDIENFYLSILLSLFNRVFEIG